MLAAGVCPRTLEAQAHAARVPAHTCAHVAPHGGSPHSRRAAVGPSRSETPTRCAGWSLGTGPCARCPRPQRKAPCSQVPRGRVS